MNKKTQILLGVGILTVVGYFVWKNNQSEKKNATGFSCPRGSNQTIVKDEDGNKYYQCLDRRGIPSVFSGDGKKVY